MLVIAETKLNESFPDSQFAVDGYYNRGNLDEIEMSMGLAFMLFVKQGILVKRIKALEPQDKEVIGLEVNIAKRKWTIFNIYRPSSKNIDLFFNEINKLIDLAINKYETLLLWEILTSTSLIPVPMGTKG